MLQKSKLTVGQLLNNSNTRLILILGTMILAALVGAAPNDYGG
jgi:hypothetical protein